MYPSVGGDGPAATAADSLQQGAYSLCLAGQSIRRRAEHSTVGEPVLPQECARYGIIIRELE